MVRVSLGHLITTTRWQAGTSVQLARTAWRKLAAVADLGRATMTRPPIRTTAAAAVASRGSHRPRRAQRFPVRWSGRLDGGEAAGEQVLGDGVGYQCSQPRIQEVGFDLIRVGAVVILHVGLPSLAEGWGPTRRASRGGVVARRSSASARAAVTPWTAPICS